MALNFDFNSLTGNEISLIESLSGQSIGSIGDPEKPMAKGMYAIALVIRRRNGEPSLTFNAVLEMTLAEVTELIGALDEEPEEDSEEGESERSNGRARK